MRLSSKRALQNAKSLTFEAGPMENSKSLLEGVSKRQLAGRPSVKFAFIFTFLAASVQDCHAFCPSSCTPGCLEMWLASFANTYVLAHNKIRKHPHSKSQFKSPRIANKSLSKLNSASHLDILTSFFDEQTSEKWKNDLINILKPKILMIFFT